MTKQINSTKETKQTKNKKELLKVVDPLKLSLDQIISEDAQYDELIKVTFDDGRYCEIYKKFRPSKIKEMLIDFADFMSEYEKTGLPINEAITDDYIGLHVIQHFSTLVGEFPKHITQKLDVFKQMLDNNLVKKTIESFDPKEYAKISNFMAEKFEMIQKRIIEDEDFKSKFKLEVSKLNIENREIIESALFGEETKEEGE